MDRNGNLFGYSMSHRLISFNAKECLWSVVLFVGSGLGMVGGGGAYLRRGIYSSTLYMTDYIKRNETQV